MRVLFFGTYDADRHPHVRVLMEGFRDLGDEVIECNEPLGLSTRERVGILRRPWRAPLLAARVLSRWTRLRRRARAMAVPDVVVVGYLGHFDVHLARRLWPRTPLVLDHMIFARDTALDRGVRFGPVVWLLGLIDGAALRAADLIAVDTDEHAAMVPPALRSRVVVAAIGATARWFRDPTAGAGEPLSAIFYGSFAPLQGGPVIGEAIARCAELCPSVRFTIVGHGQDLAATRARTAANRSVVWRDWIDPAELPAAVAAHDVCLGIFGTSPKASRVVPHKVFEGAAAGCAIVTADTPPARRALGDAAVFVPPGDARALAEAIERLAADPAAVRDLRRAAFARATEAFAGAAVVAGLRERLSREAAR
ncbi:MAG TPA: glycosyltransferase [Actinomycetota bacterium]